MDVTFKRLLASLDITKPKAQKVKLLSDLSNVWKDLGNVGEIVTEILKGNNIMPVFANVLQENFSVWKDDLPSWTEALIYCAGKERDHEAELFPVEQMRDLLAAFRQYVIKGKDCMFSFRHMAAFAGVRKLLLVDDELYDSVKRDLSDMNLWYFYSVAAGEDWQLKLLSDASFIAQLLSVPDNEDVWDIFVRIAQHPEAKTLLPKDVFMKASVSSYKRRTDLCALLCNEGDLTVLHLSDSWLEVMCKALRELLEKGTATISGTLYTILDALLPIVNLSVVDTQKELLGKKFVSLLLQVITRDLPTSFSITRYLQRSRIEAAKALWNFAYLESNRKIITAEHGIAKLNDAANKSSDEHLKHNIAGILHMFHTVVPAPISNNSNGAHTATRGHVMLSYNWGNQPIVVKIARSLQERGYSVWLDIDKMDGSVLEAMASAIEKSEMVLMCMSQKYKDSPNCRLEGEYVMNRKTKFVPLMMQKGYQPDGWLGIALGAKLYYEFYDDTNWDNKVNDIVKAIGSYGHTGSAVQAVTPAAPPKVVWTDDDLLKWMKDENIEQHFELFKRHKLSRRALLELQRNSTHSLTLLFSVFKELAYGEILEISSAIHNLK